MLKVNNKKLKILHIISQRPDSTGSGIYLQAMMQEASKAGHQNFLVAGLNTKEKPEFDFIPKKNCTFVEFNGTDLSGLIPGMSDVMPYPSKMFKKMTIEEIEQYEKIFCKKIESVINLNKPDIIHSHHLWLLTSAVKRNFPNTPMVVSCHGSDIRQFRNCMHLQDRVLSGLKKVDAVLSLHSLQNQEINQLFEISSKKIYTTGAGYNGQLFFPTLKEHSEMVHLLYAGKLSNAKGVPWLLRAISKINSEKWKLHLVGDGSGEEKQVCIDLAKELGNKVQIHGSVSQIQLAQLMKIAHVFILPSFYEGLPLVTLEALACGCRIITTDITGVKELFGSSIPTSVKLIKTPRLQFIDQPLNEDEAEFETNLTKAIKKQIALVVNRNENNFATINETLSNYSWQNVYKRVQEVYHSL